MKNISLALASIGLVGIGFASAITIYDRFVGTEVTAQQSSEPQLIAQDSSSPSTSQPGASSDNMRAISIDAEMAYSMATFCHSYLSGALQEDDYVYTRKSTNQFSPMEVEISLRGTCQNFIAAFESQLRIQTS